MSFFMILSVARACPGLTGKAVAVSELVWVPGGTFAAAANSSSALVLQGAGAKLDQPVWVHFHLYPRTSSTGSAPVCWVENWWKAVGTDDAERWKTKHLLPHKSCRSFTQRSLASACGHQHLNCRQKNPHCVFTKGCWGVMLTTLTVTT